MNHEGEEKEIQKNMIRSVVGAEILKVGGNKKKEIKREK